MKQTSLQAYDNIKESLCYSESLVLEAIKRMQPCTDKQLAYDLGWAINRVTGRRNGLMKKGRVRSAGKDHYFIQDRAYSATLWEAVE